MADTEYRLRAIETRLSALERALRLQTPAQPSVPSYPIKVSAPPRPSPPPPRIAPPPPPETYTATTILGWGGMVALVLAAAYLIRLSIDVGWLTPVRQVGLAAIGGLALIATGFILVEKNPRYASLLPACGIVVLFLADYGAHLYHGLIGPPQASVGIIAICLSALALGQFFKGDSYALFAVIGSYTGPLLLSNLRTDPTDLILYFSAWSLLFCWYAISTEQRLVYLLAAYLSFVVFDLLWKLGDASDWTMAVLFQFVQLVIFAAATMIYSVRNQSPMEKETALAHLPVLLLFYFVQYAVVREHLPQWAPWLAFGSMGLLLGAYGLAQRSLSVPAPAGRLVVAIYAAVVLLHAGYFELIADSWRPLVGLVFIIGMGAYAISQSQLARQWWPLFALAGLIFLHNYGRLLVGWELTAVPGYKILIPLYAITLYLGYWLVRDHPDLAPFQEALLYMGHVNTMAGAVQLFHNRLTVSLVWGFLAVVCLLEAITTKNKLLGRSSLFVFAAFAAKVLLFDLSGAAPLIRIGCLIVLGVTLYVGGLLYQKMETPQ